MNTAKLEKNKGFEFKLEPNFIDERKIQQEIANILGGWDKLAELESAITNSYQQHIEHNKRLLGSSFKNKYNRYIELVKEKSDTEELQSLRKELNQNRFYKTYIALTEEKQLVYNYALLLVMCISKPDGFDFEQQKEDKIYEIYSEYEDIKKKQTKELSA